jgi:hypothetical protein
MIFVKEENKINIFYVENQDTILSEVLEIENNKIINYTLVSYNDSTKTYSNTQTIQFDYTNDYITKIYDLNMAYIYEDFDTDFHYDNLSPSKTSSNFFLHELIGLRIPDYLIGICQHFDLSTKFVSPRRLIRKYKNSILGEYYYEHQKDSNENLTFLKKTFIYNNGQRKTIDSIQYLVREF